MYFATWNHFAHEYWQKLPHVGSCGERKAETAAFTGCGILTSYLILFIMFYLSTYKNKKPSAKKAVRRASKAEVPFIQETGELAADAVLTASHAIVETVAEEKRKLSSSMSSAGS